MKILALCTGNSAGSILLETNLTHRSDQPATFAKACSLLSSKAEALLALPFEEMTQEEPQAIFNRIGR